MSVKQIVYPDMSIQSYVIDDEKTLECVVIDPPRIIQDIKSYIDSKKLKLIAILETHVHADFISGALELKRAYGNLPKIYCSAAGGKEWIPNYADVQVHDGDSVDLGGYRLQARYTPGHTPEHISWLLIDKSNSDKDPVFLFTGDFLFVDGVGRPDLLGSEQTPTLLKEIHKSLFERIADLSDGLTFSSAHGAGSLCSKGVGKRANSTLGDERRRNPAFQPTIDIVEWMDNIMEGMPAAPHRFTLIKQMNLHGVVPLQSLPAIKTAVELPSLDKYAVIDFRDPDAFSKGHIPKAINVPIGHALGNWLAAAMPEGVPLLCLLPPNVDKNRIVNLIRLLGCDQAITCVMANTAFNSSDSQELPTITAVDLSKKMNESTGKVFVVDVRTPAEWNAGHIPSAHHIELSQLQEKLDSIPKDSEVIAVCGSGWRSSVAGSLLQRHGFKKVCHVAGGMSSWMESRLPINRSS